jgi:hypothetical protein
MALSAFDLLLYLAEVERPSSLAGWIVFHAQEEIH